MRKIICGTLPNTPADSERVGKDVLIVLTTCGHLDVTVLAMEHLVRSLDISDLLIVDDFSLDGTGIIFFTAHSDQIYTHKVFYFCE